MNYFVFQGGAENLDHFENGGIIKDGAESSFWSSPFFWTSPKTAKKDDVAFIYLTVPISRIVAEVGSPRLIDFDEKLTFQGLKAIFGAKWGWARYNRASHSQIPQEILKSFLKIARKKN